MNKRLPGSLTYWPTDLWQAAEGQAQFLPTEQPQTTPDAVWLPCCPL